MPEPAVGSRAVERALGLLRCLCDDGVLTDASAFPEGSTALTASDLARRMKLPTSTAHRLARTLADAGFLELDEGSLRYRLGAGRGGTRAAGLQRPRPAEGGA